VKKSKPRRAIAHQTILPDYMNNIFKLVFLGFLLAAWASCRPAQQLSANANEKIREKTEPYDLFAFQRSYPDTSFDWQAWRRALEVTRRQEAVVSRNSVDCFSGGTDWTQEGPGNVAGRLNSLAMHPQNENYVLAGFSGGGIFKTTDGGTNWTPVFDEQPELSIGDITFDPNNPNIVYAGTGDPNVPSNVFNGNGIYKSADAGNTWSYLALQNQGIISKVVVDPANSQTLYAAAMGNPYVRDSLRGIYKSSDGGQNWERVLFVHPQAGASDLVINHQNPQILYAAFWDRIRSNKESIIYGPHARIYKTTDGGATWTQLTGGLPTGIMGRTGLAISAQNPDKLYAIYVDTLSRPGGMFKTTDGGATWAPVNISTLSDAFGDFGWFFGKVRCNTYNDEDIYLLGVLLWRRQPGSNAWQVGAGAHADTHDLLFAPSGKRYLATDGGMYTNITGIAWTKSKNLPTTQFYRTNFNPHEPNMFYAGAQDNGIQKGNTGIFNSWQQVFSADGFRSVFDPNDPLRIWLETQNGSIHRSLDGGATWMVGQRCLNTTDRCNWDTPFMISRHNAQWLYAATFRMYGSVDGVGWSVLSDDLTDGVVFEPRFHNVSAIDESPVTSNKLLAGTSDGNVWRREISGPWVKISNGLPDRYVTSVHCSPTVANRIFVTHSGFRDNENIPHVHRSNDNGQSWENISANLPPMPVNDLFVLPGHADSILFAATDAGVYYSASAGAVWKRLGNSMPIIPVFNLAYNPVQKKLVAATFARGIWTFPVDSLNSQGAPLQIRVEGSVQTETGVPVRHVEIKTDTTAANGQFLLPNIPACDTLTLKPFRNDNPTNGLTTFDLVLVSRHILGLDTLESPYKLIAADANRSGSVTTYDIVELRKLILGVSSSLPNNTSWRFVPADYTFTNPQVPFLDNFPEQIQLQTGDSDLLAQDFIGIKVGDLNDSADPAAQAPAAEDRSAGVWPVLLEPQSFEAGALLHIPVFTQSGDLAALQFSLNFDPTALELVRIEPLASDVQVGHFSDSDAGRGRIAAAMELDAGAFPAGQPRPLFNLVCIARKKGALPDALQIGDAPTPALAYTARGQAFQPILERLKPVERPLLYPNPIGKSGAWLSVPPTNGAVELTLTDVNGRSIYGAKLETGDSTLLHYLRADLFPQNGNYFCTLRGREQTLTLRCTFTGH
jgi:photosystem II stability/assembly factor-like uncharacterized protein